MWTILAKLLAHPRVSAWLIARAKRTPYFHMPGYMDRFWLVPYRDKRLGLGCGPVSFWRRPFAWLLQRLDVAVRIHHIKRADTARHPHDHPWDARTIILKKWYVEKRLGQFSTLRRAGSTAPLNFGEYHHIESICPGGAWTLFITFKYRGTWGFLVDGRKVKHADYK